jgi:hypothetical protein
MLDKINKFESLEQEFFSEYQKHIKDEIDRPLLREVFSNIFLIHRAYSSGIIILLKSKESNDISAGVIMRSALENFVNFYYLSQQTDAILKRYLKKIDYFKNTDREVFEDTIKKGKHKYTAQISNNILKEKLEKIGIKSLLNVYDLLSDFTHGNPWITSTLNSGVDWKPTSLTGLTVTTAPLISLSGHRKIFNETKARKLSESIIQIYR